MILHDPFEISSRLMPAVKIGEATVSVEAAEYTEEGRLCYAVYIDLPDGTEFVVNDIRSGCQGGTLQEGMEAFLSFLGAALESRAYRVRTGTEGENEDLFAPAILDWAESHSDEIDSLLCWMQESPNLIEENEE